MHNLTIDLILGLGITKLVIGFSFMRPSMYSLYLYFYELYKILVSITNINFSLYNFVLTLLV
jgi:hypothetical protein